MAFIKISELLDGENITTSIDSVASEHEGVTYRVTNRKNPTVQITALNQTQLEDILGPNLVIPNVDTVSLSIDGSFTLNKELLVGDDTTLEIFAPNEGTQLTFDSPGNTLFKRNTANPIRSLIISNLEFIAANGTEKFLDDMIGTGRLFVTNTRVTNFADVGKVEFTFVKFNSFAFANVGRGIILKRCTTIISNGSLMRNPVANGATFMSIITDGIPVSLFIGDSLTSTILPGDRYIYLDPIITTPTSYIIKNTTVDGGGDFYQTGFNGNADAIAGAPVGSLRLKIIAHGLDEGQAVNLTGFIVNTAYNITTPITTVIDVDTVEVEITFGTAETGGNLNANSLVSESVVVTSRDNPGVPDSKSHAEARTGATLTVDGSGGTDVPIEDLTPTLGDWIQDDATEEFTVDLLNGIIMYIGIEDKTFLITYQLTAVPTSGPAQILDFDVHVNGIIQTKATTTIDTASQIKTTYVGGLFVLSNGDTVRLFKENLTNTNDTDVSVATVLVVLA